MFRKLGFSLIQGDIEKTNGLFGWRVKKGEVEESRVVLVKNKLILC